MKYHVQFLQESITCENEVVEALGSDGVFILDGRNSLATMIQDAADRMYQLRNIHKYVGYIIKKGERFGNCTCVYAHVKGGE